MGKLNQETKAKLLVRILRTGRGSLDFAKRLVADDLPKHPLSPARDLLLCICCVCRQWTLNRKIFAVRSVYALRHAILLTTFVLIRTF